MTFGVAVFIIGNIIQISAMESWVHMMMGRFIAGLGVGNLSVGVPMFQSECAPREIRGAVVASYQLMITIGILISNIACFGFKKMDTSSASWRIVIGLGILFSLPLGIGILIVPESPRWLASRGDWEGAQIALGRLRGMKHNLDHPLVQDDLKEMKDILEKERQVGQGSWAECFNPKSGIPKLVWRTFLGFFIHFLQQWTGVNYFFYYGASIFESAGIEDPIQTQLILGAVNVATTFMGLWFVERFGRRWPLFIGALWQAGWLAVFAAIGTAMNPSESKAVGIVLIVCACMFIASFASTWGPMAWVVIGESFPLRTRAKQASIATAGNWLGNCKFLYCHYMSFNTNPYFSHDCFPYSYCHRWYQLRLWFRLCRNQLGCRCPCLVFPFRISRPQSGERRPHVRPGGSQALEQSQVGSSWIHHPRAARRSPLPTWQREAQEQRVSLWRRLESRVGYGLKQAAWKLALDAYEAFLVLSLYNYGTGVVGSLTWKLLDEL